MNSGAWKATVHRVAKSQTPLKQFSTHTFTTQTGSEVSSCRKLDMNDSPSLSYFQMDYSWGMNLFMSVSKVEGKEWRVCNFL